MKKLQVACLAAAAVVWAVLPGCYEEYSHSHDGQVDDGHQPDAEVFDPQVDTFPDPQEVPPDILYDIPPEIIYDVPPDVPPDWPIDIPPDIPPDYPPDWPIDIPPDTTCVSEGCMPHGGSICCPGLSQATECDPSSGDTCTMLFCIRCGDGFCSPHETCYNCPEDCSVPPCEGGTGMAFSCSPIETHSCTCTGGDCRPVCRADSSGTSGWLDPCTGAIIVIDADCEGQTAVCSAICSRSEGWVESGTGEFIMWAQCGNRWDCEVIW